MKNDERNEDALDLEELEQVVGGRNEIKRRRNLLSQSYKRPQTRAELQALKASSQGS